MKAAEFKAKYRDAEARNWVALDNLAHIERFIRRVEGGAGLEIGCFEGKMTCWLLMHLDTMDVVDHFQGSPEHSDEDRKGLFRRFVLNTQGYFNRVRAYPWPSIRALSMLVQDRRRYDFIYVDASHDSRDVIGDAVLAWQLLKPGGLMVFDDYEWCYYEDKYRNPKPAIDFFLEAFAGELSVLHQGYQVIIQKKETV